MTDFESRAREIVGEAIGFGSLCWEPTPTGEFDSTEGARGVALFMDRLNEILRAVDAAAFARGVEAAAIEAMRPSHWDGPDKPLARSRVEGAVLALLPERQGGGEG